MLLCAPRTRFEPVGAGSSAPPRRCPNARARDHQACPKGQTRREVAVNTGRRVRARGSAPRSRGQARSPLHETGHRHRSLEGPPRGRKAAGAKERRSAEVNARRGEAGAGKGQESGHKTPVDHAISCRPRSTSSRIARRHDEAGTGTARTLGGAASDRGRTFRGGTQSGTDERSRRSCFRSSESRSHTGSSRLSFERPAPVNASVST